MTIIAKKDIDGFTLAMGKHKDEFFVKLSARGERLARSTRWLATEAGAKAEMSRWAGLFGVTA